MMHRHNVEIFSTNLYVRVHMCCSVSGYIGKVLLSGLTACELEATLHLFTSHIHIGANDYA